MQAVIHYNRVNRPQEVYTEGLICDDGVSLRTQTLLDPVFALTWSINSWQKQGLLSEGQFIERICKYLFFREWFGIMELRDSTENILGWYCDIVTPLEKRDGYYVQNDLVLDLWVWPDGRFRELDWDEFQAACTHGLINSDMQQQAVHTLQRMVLETQQGIFPGRYIRVSDWNNHG